ncbi:LPXTG cell wall anchor domain-containing protein [Mariniflexile jejuense]|uniref:LPXTG cell wall anchor domain-containing protein n=1 Tax=Mariniflexile jejuense TaxID=1173582 RepID=A0ABW3JK04_9FLAO
MKYLNYIIIILGAIVAIYAKTGTEQNQYILIGGIMLLMIGVYRISKTIPSRQDEDANLDENEN